MAAEMGPDEVTARIPLEDAANGTLVDLSLSVPEYDEAGHMRRVYPGFVQLGAFMSMNLERHKQQFRNLYGHLVEGETEKADLIRVFYDLKARGGHAPGPDGLTYGELGPRDVAEAGGGRVQKSFVSFSGCHFPRSPRQVPPQFQSSFLSPRLLLNPPSTFLNQAWTT